MMHTLQLTYVAIFSIFIFGKMGNNNNINTQKNVFGESLQACCFEPVTGFYRDGFCNTSQQDYGTHTVCAVMTEEFLEFTQKKGNDLSTPKPQYNFPGLQAGDKWCLCALRWYEAYKAGYAPNVVLEATNEKTLQMVPMEVLIEKAFK